MQEIGMRCLNWSRALLLLFGIWLLVLLFAASSSFKFSQDKKTDVVTSSRIERALVQIQNLQKQNEELRSLFDNLQNLEPAGKKGALNDVLNKAQILVENDNDAIDGVTQKQDPNFKYEELRRRLQNDVKEFWYYLNSRLKLLQKESSKLTASELNTKLQETQNVALEHRMSLLKDVDKLSKVDGYEEWRESESLSLSDFVQKKLKDLQNPQECQTAKKIVCNINKGCGYGCQMHHAAYCLIVAYATKRTLILRSKGWRYHKNGWEDMFLPVSDTCLNPTGTSQSNWPGKPTTQVLVLSIIDTITPRPAYLPPAVPAEIASRLSRIHGNPTAWWIGQMFKYLLRPQPAIAKFLHEAIERLGFKRPIVGVHIRRTDKVGTEAAFHAVDEYMKHVIDWYDQQEYNSVEIDQRRVYIATDDPKVITEAREKYPNYEVLGDADIAKTAAVSTRYTDNSLFGIILDIHLLSISDYLVCTFSSQVCRMAYEMMQTYHVDASQRFRSLDDVYYYGGQNGHSSVAVIAHHSDKADELDLQVGDHVVVAGNHWDGYSKGRNLRTNQLGLYPSFKVEDRVRIEKF